MTENTRTVKAFVERQPFVSAVLVTGMTLGALTTVFTFVDKYRPWPSHSELQKLHKERIAGDRIAYDTAISYSVRVTLPLRRYSRRAVWPPDDVMRFDRRNVSGEPFSKVLQPPPKNNSSYKSNNRSMSLG